jgi:hypothetical protein
MSNQPHDALVKSVFGEPAEAAGLFRVALPPALADRVDWSTLQRASGSYVDPDLRQRHGDLLFTARFVGGGPVLPYLLLEHQSTPERWMALRLLGYVLRATEAWRRENPRAAEVPPVLPVVLYQGESAWRAPTRLADLVAMPPELREAVRGLVPEFGFALLELTRAGDDLLRGHALGALGRLTLFTLLYGAQGRTYVELLRARMLPVIAEVCAAPTGIEALSRLVRYIETINPEVIVADLREAVAEAVGAQSAEAVMGNISQPFIDQGRAQGWRQWAAAFLRQLRVRFGEEAVHPYEQRVLTADGDKLEAWSVRFATADSLAAIFGPEP